MVEERIDFQLLLDKFQGELLFLKLLTETGISPDESLYRIRTNDGDYCIFETDDWGNKDFVAGRIEESVGKFKHFIQVKNPPESPIVAAQLCVRTIYAAARNFVELEKCPEYPYTSSTHSCFLIKMYMQDVVIEHRATHNKE